MVNTLDPWDIPFFERKGYDILNIKRTTEFEVLILIRGRLTEVIYSFPEVEDMVI